MDTMQVFIELSAVFLAAIIFVALCGLATYVFQAVLHPEEREVPLFPRPYYPGDPEDDDPCLADETLQYPLQVPSNFTDYR